MQFSQTPYIIWHPSLLGINFEFHYPVIPEVFYRESIVYNGFLLKACRNDANKRANYF